MSVARSGLVALAMLLPTLALARDPGFTRGRIAPPVPAAAPVAAPQPVADAAPADEVTQGDPALRSVVEQAIKQTRCVSPDRDFDSEIWFKFMEPRLRSRVPDAVQRMDILREVYCETHRDGASPLPAGLIMAILDVESGFKPWAVSSAGAVGLMQVMPFWPERLGWRRDQLTRVGANIHMGCAILRFYLEQERRDVRRALARYNGSAGHSAYPDAVVWRWHHRWNWDADAGERRQSVQQTHYLSRSHG